MAQPCKKVRASYTYDQKIRALERLQDLEEDPSCPWPWKQVCLELGLPPSKWSYVSKWRKRADHIRACVAAGHGTCSRYRDVPARYPAEEDELYIRFLNRRIVHGYPANHWWLQREMHRILAESAPVGWHLDHCKASWSAAFCHRYRITLQCGYNSKAQDITDRQTCIKKFHQYLAILQASSGRNHRGMKNAWRLPHTHTDTHTHTHTHVYTHTHTHTHAHTHTHTHTQTQRTAGSASATPSTWIRCRSRSRTTGSAR